MAESNKCPCVISNAAPHSEEQKFTIGSKWVTYLNDINNKAPLKTMDFDRTVLKRACTEASIIHNAVLLASQNPKAWLIFKVQPCTHVFQRLYYLWPRDFCLVAAERPMNSFQNCRDNTASRFPDALLGLGAWSISISGLYPSSLSRDREMASYICADSLRAFPVTTPAMLQSDIDPGRSAYCKLHIRIWKRNLCI